MGNALLKHYDWDRSKAASGGVGMLWQIFPGRDRKSKKQVSIFLIQKKSIPRVGRDELWEKVIKKDASILTKLRHPHVLDVKRAPCEDRSALVFVTEPVVCSLANLLGDTRGIEGVVPGAAAEGKDGKGNGSTSLQLPAHLANVQITHLDVKNGLRQLVECLEFLHTSGRLIHGHVSPCNIYLTPSGHWKLAGFGFSQKAETQTTLVDCGIDFGPFDTQKKKGATKDKLLMVPEFIFSAPEMVLKKRYDSRVDVFSLGQVAYHLCKFIAKKQHSPKPVASIDEYRAWIGSLHRPLILDSIPKTLRKYLARMLAVDPTHRASLKGFLSSEYYNDVLVRTLRYLDGLLQTDLKTRVQFLRQLPKVINLFDARNAEMKVLPKLMLQWKVGEKPLMLYTLPAILKCAERMPKRSFAEKIVPVLRRVSQIKTPQFVYVVLSNFTFLVEKTDDGQQQGLLVPLLLAGLESKENRLQDLAMRKIVETANANKFAYSALKTDILPKIQRLAKGPGPAEVRAGALNAIGNLFELFDKVTVKELIIPAVNDAIKFGRSAILLRAAIRLYSSLGKAMGANITATTLLPMVTPLLMESCLSKADVANLLEITQTMLSSVGRLRLAQLSDRASAGSEVDASGLTAALDDSGDVGTFSDLLAKEYATKPTPGGDVVSAEVAGGGGGGGGRDPFDMGFFGGGNSSSSSRSGGKTMMGAAVSSSSSSSSSLPSSTRTGRQTKLPARVTSQNQQSSTTTTTQASNDGTSDAFNFLSGGGGGPTTNISNADDIFGDLMSGSTGSTKNNGNSSNPLHHQRNGMGGNSSSSKHSSSRGGSSSASALDDPFGDFGFGGGNDRSRNSNNAAMNKHSSSNKMVRSGGAGGEGGGGEASVISKMTKRGSSGSVSRGTSVGFMGGTTNSSNLMGGMIGAGSSGGMDDFLGGFAAGTRTAPGSMGGNGGGGDVLDFLETGNSGFNKVVGTMGQNSGVAPGSSGAENDILDFLN